MKKLEALLPVSDAPEIIDELCELEVENLIASNVTVVDKNVSRKMIYRGCVYEEKSSRKVKVELDVSDRDYSSAEALLLGK